jgi:hypothetical protein
MKSRQLSSSSGKINQIGQFLFIIHKPSNSHYNKENHLETNASFPELKPMFPNDECSFYQLKKPIKQWHQKPIRSNAYSCFLIESICAKLIVKSVLKDDSPFDLLFKIKKMEREK